MKNIFFFTCVTTCRAVHTLQSRITDAASQNVIKKKKTNTHDNFFSGDT